MKTLRSNAHYECTCKNDRGRGVPQIVSCHTVIGLPIALIQTRYCQPSRKNCHFTFKNKKYLYISLQTYEYVPWSAGDDEIHLSASLCPCTKPPEHKRCVITYQVSRVDVSLYFSTMI